MLKVWPSRAIRWKVRVAADGSIEDVPADPVTRARAISIMGNGSPAPAEAISSAASGASSGKLSMSRRCAARAVSGWRSIR